VAQVKSARDPRARDQDESPFSNILTELCRATGAQCAALVDQEGESVDYGGVGDPFDIRVLAAEWRLVLAQAQFPELGGTTQMMVRARKKSFWIESFPAGYALIIQLGRRSSTLSARALSHARRELCSEAGFIMNRQCVDIWTRVLVNEESGPSRRPGTIQLANESYEVTVLGRVTSASKSERGYRIRMMSGEERTLVREALGHWYLEEEIWI
jgi:hypothetical protein